MLVSRYWLQKFFDAELPGAQTLADVLTFHAFEIESVEERGSDWILDVKVTPNRGHDCLCHRGIARELAAILNLPLAHDPLTEPLQLSKPTTTVSVTIEDADLCRRYIAGHVRNITVGPPPKWLKERLESIGQKSINNIVDATNFVMFNTGQPLHAFDAGKLRVPLHAEGNPPQYAITVRNARKDEKITTLDNKEYSLTDSMLLIVDGNSDAPIGIAGVKGGLPAAITEETKDIIIESANFDGASVRKTAQQLKLRTDASTRFEQAISPELAAYGMQSAVDLILKIAEGELVGFVDTYPDRQNPKEVFVTLDKINMLLGENLSAEEVENVFKRLGFSFSKDVGFAKPYMVKVPFERLDLEIAEDLVEEVGRILGYDRIPPTPLPIINKKSKINENFIAAEQIREDLISKGYSEVYTSVFAEKGERVVANKIDAVRPYLRTNLVDGLKEAYEKNKRNAEFLGLKEIKLFEIGTAWKDSKEMTIVSTADKSGVRESLLEKGRPPKASAPQLPLSNATRYEPFSKYPFIIRDVAFWTPADSNAEAIEKEIRNLAGELCIKVFLFDRFEKDNRVSLAYRLIFQSSERTLTEEEINPIMAKIYATLKEKGFEIR